MRAGLQEIMDESLIHIIKPRAEYEEYVNMVYGCHGEFHIFDVNCMNDDVVQLHATFFHMDDQEVHHYGSCQICCRDSCGYSNVRRVVKLLLDNGTIKVTGNKNDYNGFHMIDDYSV